jgi:hypothetical protein
VEQVMRFGSVEYHAFCGDADGGIEAVGHGIASRAVLGPEYGRFSNGRHY